jgi:hypothetical protein
MHSMPALVLSIAIATRKHRLLWTAHHQTLYTDLLTYVACLVAFAAKVRINPSCQSRYTYTFFFPGKSIEQLL